jgi:hypothetical protein
MSGATSADVHTGLGHPGSGQVASEKPHGEEAGLVGRGASGVPSGNRPADERLDPNQRAVKRESAQIAGQKPKTHDSAEDRVGVTSEELATERE